MYFIFFLFFILYFHFTITVKPNLPFGETQGAIWPKPRKQDKYNSYLVIHQNEFKFQIAKYDCDLLLRALRRYYEIIFVTTKRDLSNKNNKKENASEIIFSGSLELFQIVLENPCEEYPHENMDESYELHINNPERYKNKGVLISRSIWGILRGLESFSQMVVSKDKFRFTVRSTWIEDYPRFPHRGLLIDTSRHYLPVSIILKIIHAMSYSKLNILHWHIVDDQSFPFKSKTFPLLSEKGAYNKNLAVYTHEDVERIIEFARERGIRVYPEFDTPGHTFSWHGGIPDFLTPCKNLDEDGPLGPVNPSREENYNILFELFTEVSELFPDKYLHLGGDEVDFNCWSQNDDIVQFMDQMNITGDYKKLQDYYIRRVVEISKMLNSTPIVWQEVLANATQVDEYARVDRDAIIQIWMGDYRELLKNITKKGYKTLLSACWYLDHLNSGSDWELFYYECNPSDFEGSDEEKKLVLGGEACMWGEYVDETNIQQRIWPRACAVAEILWSEGPEIGYEMAVGRLEEHTCRLKRRGIPAQPPNLGGFCPVDTEEEMSLNSNPLIIYLSDSYKFIPLDRSIDDSFDICCWSFLIPFGALLFVFIFVLKKFKISQITRKFSKYKNHSRLRVMTR